MRVQVGWFFVGLMGCSAKDPECVDATLDESGICVPDGEVPSSDGTTDSGADDSSVGDADDGGDE